MKRLIVIAAALVAVVGAPMSRAVRAQELPAQSELVDVLSSIDKGKKIRLQIAGTEKPQEWRLWRYTQDTLLLKHRRDLVRTYAGDIDSVWVRTGGKSGVVGLLVGGGIGAVFGGLAGLAIYDAIDFRGGIFGPPSPSKPGPAILVGAATGFVIAGTIGAILVHDSGDWEQLFPSQASKDHSAEANRGQNSQHLRLNVMPDPGIGVHVAASYTF